MNFNIFKKFQNWLKGPRFISILLSFLLCSCVTSDKDFDHKNVEDTSEFEDIVKVENIESEEPAAEPKSSPDNSKKKTSSSKKAKKVVTKEPSKKEKIEKKAQIVKTSKKQSQKASKKEESKPSGKQAKVADKKEKAKAKGPRQPRLEDDEGFDGRRPEVMPYKVGEEIVMGISYFAVEAGKFTMKVEPMKQVNGRKSYHFKYIIKSSPLFNLVYRVDDVAETFVDYENLLPYSYEIHVDESKQVRETRTFFDHKNNTATMWDRKQKKGEEVEKKKITWDILSFSQNVFSVAYYLRTFTLKVGKELKVRVAHEGKNIVMTAKVIRRETIYTDAGKFDTFVVKPKFNVEGKFKPTGENYLWLTADDRKFIVRLESKIKIGSIVGEVQKIKK